MRKSSRLRWAVRYSRSPAECPLAAADPAPVPATTPWDLPRLQDAPPAHTWIQQDGPIHSLTYAGEPYQGHPTRVFAYYASPTTLGSTADKPPYPGIVLVHGGGGKGVRRMGQDLGRTRLCRDRHGSGRVRRGWPTTAGRRTGTGGRDEVPAPSMRPRPISGRTMRWPT